MSLLGVGYCMDPSAWLSEACLPSTAEGVALLCAIRGNASLRAAVTRSSAPAAVQQRLVVSGDPRGAILDLAGGGVQPLLRIEANASVTIQRLIATGVALPESHPLPAASFLALRAFSMAAPLAGSNAPAASPLRLEDVILITPSCRALAVHQEFACRASPSPNFTVTPGGLVVWSYTTASVAARNVTLSCVGEPLPYSCTAYVANSPRGVVDALVTLDGVVVTGSPTPKYIFLNSSMALGDAADYIKELQHLHVSAIKISPTTGQAQITLLPKAYVVIAGAPLPQDLATSFLGSSSSSNFTTAPQAVSWDLLPPTIVDLAGTSSMVIVPASARVELHNLTIINPPINRPSLLPANLLALPLWTFTFSRRILSQNKSQWALYGRGLAVALEPHELALWHADLCKGRVPDELAGCLCVADNGLMNGNTWTPSQNAQNDNSAVSPVLLRGGAMFVPFIRTEYVGQTLMESLLMFPRAAPADGSGVLAPACPIMTMEGLPLGAAAASATPAPVPATPGATMAGPAGPADGSSSLAIGAALAPALAPLCSVRPPFSSGLGSLRKMERAGPALTPALLTRSALTHIPLAIMLDGDSHFKRDDVVYRPEEGYMRLPRESFTRMQAQIFGLELWLGDPLGPRLLHLSFMAAAVNVHSPNATLALRQLVLVGLPTAGLHAASPALGSGRDSAATAAAVGGSAQQPPQATTAPAAEGGGRRLLTNRHGPTHHVASTIRGLASTAPARRRAQVMFVNGSLEFDGPPAGTDPTGGLPHGLANFTSCLWALDFDRSAPRDPPAAFLDSVVLLVPPGELAVLAAAWAEQLAVEGRDGADESTGAADAFTLAPAASDAGAVFAHLAASLRASRLAVGATPASLQRLTARLLAMQQQQAAGVTTAGGDAGAGAALLAFETLSWCGLAGRNVTLAAELPPDLVIANIVASQQHPHTVTGGHGADSAFGSGHREHETDPESSTGSVIRCSHAPAGGDLVLLGELGRGAQGVVFHGRWKGLSVAVKSITFQRGANGDPRVGHRPVLEAAISAFLNHPNVVTTYAHQLTPVGADAAEPPGGAGGEAFREAPVWRLTLVQELCDGGSLARCLDSAVLANISVVSETLALAPTSTSKHAGFLDWAPVALSPHRSAKPSLSPTAEEAAAPEDGGTGRRSLTGAPGAAAEVALALPPGPRSALAPRVALLLSLQISRGMAYLHSLGVLHGDLSSVNVLMRSAPTSGPPAPQQPEAQQKQQWLLQRARLDRRLAAGCAPHGDGSRARSPSFSSKADPRAAAGSWLPAGATGGGGRTATGQPAAARFARSGSSGQTPPGMAAGWVAASGQRHSCGYVAKVCDFGLSSRLEGSETHFSGEARRSLLYSAPELVQYGISSKATDVYAFAVLLYEIACGASLPSLLRDPHRGAGLRRWLADQEAPGTPAAALPPSLLTWPPGAPPGLAALAAQCLAERPAERPSFTEVCDALETELLELDP
ncbi:hypothetical protein GPECTOR_16g574 [Gonium pectorale]|uniref:Protein kinase domain-containing protein n=1 Tax=Gonium pectorale TaxID=33097 RepID=A0A150GKS7_GONPE|nr:hypothetical protein GPECTOR_16g574 [Gonium pectorale]|eukprot:KXZ50401.1 hypothetical protein GPECTOR_16g574 [Gonium pectorale]